MNQSEFIKNYLLSTFPDARLASGGTEVVMRCRFCGDSQKDKNARHLYIKVSDVPLYNCFKCNTSGILTDEILRRYFLNSYNDKDLDFFYKLRSYNKELSNQIKTYAGNRTSFSVTNDYITLNVNTINKLNYINNRLGLSLDYNEILQNKIVLNLLDLIQSNYINSFTRSYNILQNMNDDCIGFLSVDNGFVTLRNISTNAQYRYQIYTLFNNIDNGKKFYVIPTSINLNDNTPVNIHITEGPFDILSIFYNLCNANRFQNIYIAICGKSYISAIKFILNIYGIINSIFHIYIDNDIKEYELYSIKNILSSLNIPGYIHRNGYNKEKDFGVDKNKINDIINKI